MGYGFKGQGHPSSDTTFLLLPVGAGLSWVATNGDTTSVGAQALAVGSGLDRGLGRVKGRAPDRELRDGPCRESFHDEHGGSTVWTTEASGLGGPGTGEHGHMGFGVVQQQTLTVGQELGATTIGQESEGTDADKAAGQNMQQETSQELVRGERHHPLLITVRIIFPAEGNLVLVEGHETVVANGHAMGVAGEIAQHMLGTADCARGAINCFL
jgi:hypothetical protein